MRNTRIRSFMNMCILLLPVSPSTPILSCSIVRDNRGPAPPVSLQCVLLTYCIRCLLHSDTTRGALRSSSTWVTPGFKWHQKPAGWGITDKLQTSSGYSDPPREAGADLGSLHQTKWIQQPPTKFHWQFQSSLELITTRAVNNGLHPSQTGVRMLSANMH